MEIGQSSSIHFMRKKEKSLGEVGFTSLIVDKKISLVQDGFLFGFSVCFRVERSENVEKLSILERAGEEEDSLYQVEQLNIASFGCKYHILDENMGVFAYQGLCDTLRIHLNHTLLECMSFCHVFCVGSNALDVMVHHNTPRIIDNPSSFCYSWISFQGSIKKREYIF
jgi:hypothetical protein